MENRRSVHTLKKNILTHLSNRSLGRHENIYRRRTEPLYKLNRHIAKSPIDVVYEAMELLTDKSAGARERLTSLIDKRFMMPGYKLPLFISQYNVLLNLLQKQQYFIEEGLSHNFTSSLMKIKHIYLITYGNFIFHFTVGRKIPNNGEEDRGYLIMNMQMESKREVFNRWDLLKPQLKFLDQVHLTEIFLQLLQNRSIDHDKIKDLFSHRNINVDQHTMNDLVYYARKLNIMFENGETEDDYKNNFKKQVKLYDNSCPHIYEMEWTIDRMNDGYKIVKIERKRNKRKRTRSTRFGKNY